MSKLKIIEATYYDRNNIAGGFNVTKDLLQMLDIDNNCLNYKGLKGSYNDIFGDPAKSERKRLKIILEYNGQKFTHVYKEDEDIKLPEDLNAQNNKNEARQKNLDEKRSSNKFYEIFMLEPNLFGFGIYIKKLIKFLNFEKNKIIFISILIIVVLISSYWWFLPVKKQCEEIKTRYFTNYNDLSKTLNTSIFSVVSGMNQLSSENEKERFINNYSYLRTGREYGFVDDLSTSSESEIFVNINGSIICSFDNKWKRKLMILEAKEIEFYGIIKGYDTEKKKVLMFNCNLLK